MLHVVKLRHHASVSLMCQPKWTCPSIPCSYHTNKYPVWHVINTCIEDLLYVKCEAGTCSASCFLFYMSVPR